MKRMENREAIASLKTLCNTCTMFPKCVNDKPECFQAIEMAISALEKQIPQKPEMIWDTTFGKTRPHCLVCGASNPTGANYCWNCGQRFIAEEES